MVILSVILALIAERFLLDQETYRHSGWFKKYLNWCHRQSLGEWINSGTAGVIGSLLPPLAAVALIQALLHHVLGGVLEFLFATGVLLYCLGPRNLDRQVEDFVDAWDEGDQDKASEIVQDLVADDPPGSQQDFTRTVTDGILKQACYRIFGILFWFMVLGPLGALLYRLSRDLHTGVAVDMEPDKEFLNSVRRLLEILNWLPARITAASYALAGNFQEAIIGWRGKNELEREEESAFASADQVLILSGRGALGLEHAPEAQTTDAPSHHAEAALGLIWRSLTIWVALPAITVFTFWIG